MAKIDMIKIKKVSKERNSIHEEVFATYCTFTENGLNYFQIDTYGRSTRENVEKISQSFQIDENSAPILIQLLLEHCIIKGK